MEYTKEDRAIAKSIASPKILALIEKVLSEKYPFESDNEKKVTELNDAEYGQIMKVHYIARRHLTSCLDRILELAKDKPDGERKHTGAPR